MDGEATTHEDLPSCPRKAVFLDRDSSAQCACRKPKPGMLLEAARRWGLDLERSFMVGDRWSDILAGQAAGCRSVLIANPYSGADRCRPDHSVATLPAAVDWILT